MQSKKGAFNHHELLQSETKKGRQSAMPRHDLRADFLANPPVEIEPNNPPVEIRPASGNNPPMEIETSDGNNPPMEIETSDGNNPPVEI